MVNFGKNLLEIRLFLDITQTELAERCNLKPSAISHFECGRRLPNFDNIKSLKQALGCSYERLLDGSN